MPKQTYDLYTKDAYNGMVAYVSEPYIIVSSAADEDINVGIALVEATTEGTVEWTVSPIRVFGIAVRVANYETSTRPSDGSYYYPKTSTVAVLRQGTFYVKVAYATTKGGTVTTKQSTRELGGAGGVGSIQNITWLEDGAIGDYVLARIDIVK